MVDFAHWGVGAARRLEPRWPENVSISPRQMLACPSSTGGVASGSVGSVEEQSVEQDQVQEGEDILFEGHLPPDPFLPNRPNCSLRGVSGGQDVSSPASTFARRKPGRTP